MLFYDFEAGNKTYKLRLNTRNIVVLEKLLGESPLAIFKDEETLPTISAMVNILYCALQQYNHGITMEDAYNIFDEYLEENAATDFISVIIEVYKVSGLIKAKTEKN